MSDASLPTGISSFAELLTLALGSRLSPTSRNFIEMMAPDGVMEFPFSPPGGVTKLEGRDALSAYLSRLATLIQIDRLALTEARATDNPDVMVLEFTCNGKGIQTGRPYSQRYISVITTRDGYITRYVDYWNPLVVIEATGGLDAWLVAMSSEPL